MENMGGHQGGFISVKEINRTRCSMPILKYYSYHFRNLYMYISYKRTARFDVVLVTAHEQTVSSTVFLKDDERLLYRLLCHPCHAQITKSSCII